MKTHIDFYVKNIIKMLDSEYFNLKDTQDKLKIRHLNDMNNMLVKVCNQTDLPTTVDINLLIRLHDLILASIETKKEIERLENFLDNACY